MSLKDSEYKEELETAVEAAKEAAEVMERYREDIQVKDRKGSFNDVVTEADEKCQKVIEEVLMREFPEDGFKAEELKEEREAERMWVVDPIDGTSNFLKGFEYYYSSIALKESDEVKVAVVLSPEGALGKMWFASEGEGAYLSEKQKTAEAEKIEVSDHDGIQGSLVTSKRKAEHQGQENYDSFVNEQLVESEAMIRIIDAGALSCARVAEGVFDGFISGIENEWDYLAGKLLVKEAGGNIRDESSPIGPVTEVVASNGEVQEQLENIADHYIQDS